jgi:hypothetical protein
MTANIRECAGELIFKDEVYRIVGAAIEVSNNMGCGFLEAERKWSGSGMRTQNDQFACVRVHSRLQSIF